jgi:hypothetical protein
LKTLGMKLGTIHPFPMGVHASVLHRGLNKGR